MTCSTSISTSFPHNKPMASTFRRPKKPIACNLNQVDDVSFRDQSDVTYGIGMDSFSVSKLQMKGTKVWTNGCSLVSTGLRELDALMLSSSGSIGGQPLGTCICLESLDRFWSVLSNCIVRYWCAEAICQDQSLIIPIELDDSSVDESQSLKKLSTWTESDRQASISESNIAMATPEIIYELLDSLPININFQQEKRNSDIVTAGSVSMPLQTLAEEHERLEIDDDQNAEEGLVVAWQYRKNVQQERLGLRTSNMLERRNVAGRSNAVYCHSYNLQGRLKDQMDVYSFVSLIPILVGEKSRDSPPLNGIKWYQQLVSAIQSSLCGGDGNGSVTRILLYHPDMTLCSFALPLLLHYIRKHKLPVVILVVPSSASSTDHEALIHIRRCSDVVMSTESFTMRKQYPPPAEFRHLHGLLHINRLSTMTQSTISGHFADRTLQRSPATVRYGLHRDRRKLNISLLHIPPEDYAVDGDSVSSGAVRLGAGRPTLSSESISGGCGGSTGQSLFDF